jgi:hypothetical protein
MWRFLRLCLRCCCWACSYNCFRLAIFIALRIGSELKGITIESSVEPGGAVGKYPAKLAPGLCCNQG